MTSGFESDNYFEYIVKKIIDNKPVSDTDLLAVILGKASEFENSRLLADRIISKYGGLSELCLMSYSQLVSIDGIDEMTAFIIRHMCSCLSNIVDKRTVDGMSFNTKEEAITALKMCFMSSPMERLFVMLINSKGEVTNLFEITRGSSRSVEYDIRYILENVSRHQACYVYLVHNHIENYMPSMNDIVNTERIASLVSKLGAQLMDHLIYYNGEMVSMRNGGYLIIHK